jgi:AAA15 family ATPase/GTPase
VLINFSVENFRSFGAEQTLNLIASGKLQDHPEHRIPISKTGKYVLRTGVVYGANAAGKSNLVRAIVFAQSLIQGNILLKKIALNQFRFSKKKKPSCFEFRFMVEEQIFVYGFAITQDAVSEEWLHATTQSSREAKVFTRKGQAISIGNLKAFGSESETSDRALEALKILTPRPDQLLLNKVVDIPQSSRGELLNRAAWWFSECLTVVQAEMSYAPLLEFLDTEANFRRFAGAFLENVGTGVTSLHIDQAEIGADKIPKELLQGLQAPKGEEATLLLNSASVSLQLDPNDPTKVIRRNLAANHRVQNTTFSLPFPEESDGTQRCLHLLPALYHLTTSKKVFVIDELDRSLHPLLSYAFLKFFVEFEPTAYRQLVLTTHETHLLDQELLRRDEVWFVEKDDKQQTQLYSLVDMKVRNDVRIEKGYLQGRFGGIPFIGDPKKLIDMLHSTGNGKPNAKKTPS